MSPAQHISINEACLSDEMLACGSPQQSAVDHLQQKNRRSVTQCELCREPLSKGTARFDFKHVPTEKLNEDHEHTHRRKSYLCTEQLLPAARYGV